MKSRTLTLVTLGLLLVAGAAFAQTNNMTVNGAAALGGTSNGLSIFMDTDDTTSVFVQSNEPNAETHFIVDWRMRLQNLNAPAAGGGRHFRFMTWHEADSPVSTWAVFFAQRQATTGNWRLAIWTWDDDLSNYVFAGGTFLGGYQVDQDIHLRCEWTQETGASAGDGELACYRALNDNALGSPKFTTSNLNTNAQTIGAVRFGFLDFDGFPNAGLGSTDGTLHLDEYQSYR